MIDLIILLLSIPVGLLIAWLARDELIDGYIYIKTLAIVSFMWVLITKNEVIILSLGFISIVASISVIKRFDKAWATERKR